MNRRVFLRSPILLLPTNKNMMERHQSVFVSNNKKLTVKMTYFDYDSQVLLITEKEWYDPITNDIRKDVLRQMFILDSFDA